MTASDSPTGARQKNHYTQSETILGFDFDFSEIVLEEIAAYKCLIYLKLYYPDLYQEIRQEMKTKNVWRFHEHVENAVDSDHLPSFSLEPKNLFPKAHESNCPQKRERNKHDQNPKPKSATLTDSISRNARAFYHKNNEMSSDCMILSKKYYHPKNKKCLLNEYGKKKKKS